MTNAMAVREVGHFQTLKILWIPVMIGAVLLFLLTMELTIHDFLKVRDVFPFC